MGVVGESLQALLVGVGVGKAVLGAAVVNHLIIDMALLQRRSGFLRYLFGDKGVGGAVTDEDLGLDGLGLLRAGDDQSAVETDGGGEIGPGVGQLQRSGTAQAVANSG